MVWQVMPTIFLLCYLPNLLPMQTLARAKSARERQAAGCWNMFSPAAFRTCAFRYVSSIVCFVLCMKELHSHVQLQVNNISKQPSLNYSKPSRSFLSIARPAQLMYVQNGRPGTWMQLLLNDVVGA